MLGDRHDVRAGDLKHLNALLHSRVEVDVVTSNTRCDAELQILGLCSMLRTFNNRSLRVIDTDLLDEIGSKIALRS